MESQLFAALWLNLFLEFIVFLILDRGWPLISRLHIQLSNRPIACSRLANHLSVQLNHTICWAEYVMKQLFELEGLKLGRYLLEATSRQSRVHIPLGNVIFYLNKT